MQRRSLLFILILLLLLAGNVACQPEEAPAPTLVVSAATAVPSATETLPAPESTATQSAPTRLPMITAESFPALGELPEPSILDVAWDNREIFAPGLIASQQPVLAELPGATVYHLDIFLSDDLTSLSGQEEVLYTNREDVALAVIYFRLFPNLTEGATTVSAVQVNGRAVEPEYDQQGSALRVPLPTPLAPGEQAVVSLAFEVMVPVAGGGNYGTFIFDEDVLALAHFYPMVAVYDDEGWNVEIAPEYGDVVYAESSFYLVRISAPGAVTLVASGVPVEETEDGERQLVTYAAGPMRDFYLVASERFVPVSEQVGETTVHAYTFPEFEEAGAASLAQAVAAVESFNEIFGVYPFTELDLASTPTLALGVEYPGTIVVTDRLFDPAGGYPPVVLESTTVHEVAHQWFYSLVGNDQIDEPWLDESLTQYATLLYFADLYGERGREAFRSSLVDRWERVELAEIPIGLPVGAYEGPEYSAIVYGRGPLFFEALAERMGPDDFDTFLREYYQTHMWEIATPESLRAVAESACDCDLESLFEEWVYLD